MGEFYNTVNKMTDKRKNTASVILILFIAWQAIWIFPLKYEISLFNAIVLISYIFIGIFIGLLQKISKRTMLILAPILNLVGLGFRILIEWGEVSITEGLSFMSATMTYIPLVALIYIGYFYSCSYVEEEYPQ